MRPPVVSQLFLLLMLLGAAACAPSQSRAKADFRATDAAGRVPAIVGAAGEEDPDTLAQLVHALSDDDPAVRLFAIQSLRERTGESFGYRYYETADQRQAATERWQAWLADQAHPQLALPPTNDPTD